MPKYYCDYCDAVLQHDSESGRRTHNQGRKHKDNVRQWYENWIRDNPEDALVFGATPFTFPGLLPMPGQTLELLGPRGQGPPGFNLEAFIAGGPQSLPSTMGMNGFKPPMLGMAPGLDANGQPLNQQDDESESMGGPPNPPHGMAPPGMGPPPGGRMDGPPRPPNGMMHPGMRPMRPPMYNDRGPPLMGPPGGPRPPMDMQRPPMMHRYGGPPPGHRM